MDSATTVNLSSHDACILHTLFDPEGALLESVKIAPTTATCQLQPPSWIETEERLAVHLLNKEKPDATEVHQAISRLTKIISRDAHYASAYNNRAQATRLLCSIEDLANYPLEVCSIIADLTMAISCATPATPTAAISEKDAAVLSSAYTHRGYLLWWASRPSTPQGVFRGIEGLKELSKEELEDFASREFSMGGRYGNKAARELSVRTNPYAKLCGSIVKEALRKEISNHHTGAS